MTRVEKIQVKKAEESNQNLNDLQKLLEECLKMVASATERMVAHDSKKVTVIFYKEISLQTVNKILNFFLNKGIEILKVTWNKKVSGPTVKGHMEIIVS